MAVIEEFGSNLHPGDTAICSAQWRRGQHAICYRYHIHCPVYQRSMVFEELGVARGSSLGSSHLRVCDLRCSFAGLSWTGSQTFGSPGPDAAQPPENRGIFYRDFWKAEILWNPLGDF